MRDSAFKIKLTKIENSTEKLVRKIFIENNSIYRKVGRPKEVKKKFKRWKLSKKMKINKLYEQ